jgi:hypothetical protein
MATCHCVRALKGKIVDILFIYHNCINKFERPILSEQTRGQPLRLRNLTHYHGDPP